MTADTLAFLANTVVAGSVASCVATVTHWFLLRQAGVPVTNVQFFFGPGTVRFQWLGTKVEFGSIPGGSSVLPDETAFRSLHWARHLAIVLSGPASLLLLAMLSLGPPIAFQHFVHGFWELLQGVLRPKTTGSHLVSQFRAVYDISFLNSTGILCAKLATLNILPLAGPAFYQVVRWFFKSDEHPVLKKIHVIHVLSGMALFGGWGYAMMYYALTAK